MPPQLSEDEASDISSTGIPTKQAKKVRRNEDQEKPEILQPVSDAEEEEGDDEEQDEDEYVVEKITSHIVDEETGSLLFEIKWEGYEKKSDRTWEPEENLTTADKILNAYLESHGGKESILRDWEEKKAGKSTKKRGRASTGTTAPESGAKRGRKSNGTNPSAGTPPRGAEFKPPSGNWEEEVVAIDACEGTEGAVVVFLTWKSGQKTQHPLAQVYKRCPQKMLKFYESHLVFKKNDEA